MYTFLLVTAIVILLLMGDNIPKASLQKTFEAFKTFKAFGILSNQSQNTPNTPNTQPNNQKDQTDQRRVLDTLKKGLKSYNEYKFKQSDKISKDISKKLKLELENFRDYAPEHITVPDYLFKNQEFKIDPSSPAVPIASNSLDNNVPVDISSEMSISWSEKTANNAHSHYFKLMDSLPRAKVPDPTQWTA